jgi:HEAT repeat protein
MGADPAAAGAGGISFVPGDQSRQRRNGLDQQAGGREDLQDTALYSNDLRVRAAAIEINLVVNNLARTYETADPIMRSAESIPSNRPWVAWELGMLANRGVEPERIHQLLVTYIHEPEPQTRFWAVEGLAHLGTDETIKDFLEVLGSDVSMDVRERAGCSLAKSGMLTREQRMRRCRG